MPCPRLTAGLAALLGLGVAAALPLPARAAGVLTVAMTAGDIPVTTGNPDQGFEGFRFVGWNLYDALINWDLSKSDAASDIKPGLATEWHVDPNDHKRWLFTLREGVKWHDGCPFTADDVVWNFAARQRPQVAAVQRPVLRADAGVPHQLRPRGEGGRPHGGDHHQVRGVAVPLRHVLRADGQPLPRRGAAQRLERLRAAALRHGAVQVRVHDRARAHGDGAQHRVLGQGARAQAGPPGDPADARGRDAHRRAAERPGELRGGAGAGRDPRAQARGHADRHQLLPAQLALHPELHQGAVPGPARAPGRELRDQPRRRGGPGGWPRHPRVRRGAAQHALLRPPRADDSSTRRRPPPCSRTRSASPAR